MFRLDLFGTSSYSKTILRLIRDRFSLQAQSPETAAAGPTFEQLVEQRVASTLQVVSVLVAKSRAPQAVKDAVLAEAEQELTACAEQAVVDRLPGPFYACSGRVLSNASTTLSAAASSGASSVN